MAKKRTPLVEVSDRYQLFSDWLTEQDESYAEIPADHLQIAVRRYHEFQASDMNKAANAERIRANAERRETASVDKPARKSSKKSSKAKATPADDEDEDSGADNDAPAAAPAKRPAAKRGGKNGKTRAAF